jgi:hypothetical protein
MPGGEAMDDKLSPAYTRVLQRSGLASTGVCLTHAQLLCCQGRREGMAETTCWVSLVPVCSPSQQRTSPPAQTPAAAALPGTALPARAATTHE